MNKTETVSFSSAPEVFQKAQVAFERLRTELARLFEGARIEHVGSTALPGSLTKGDLDVQVIVRPGEFKRVKDVLTQRYQSNTGAFSSNESASFKDDGATPPIGIHVTIAGCSDDFQWRFRDALMSRADLRKEYDDLKRDFEGKSMDDYRNAKERFFERLKSAPEYQRTLGTT